MKPIKFSLVLLSMLLAHFTGAQESDQLMIPEAFKTHPEYNQIKFENDPGSQELIHLRTEKSRTFKSSNGDYHTQQTGGYFHFRNAQNQWISIQDKVSANPQDARNLGIFRSEMPMSVNTLNGKTQMTLEKNGRSVSYGNNVQIRFLGQGNQLISSRQSNSSIVGVSSDDHTITLNDFFPGIDRVQTLEYWSLRTDYLLKQKLSLPENTETVEFADHIILPAGWQIRQAEGEMLGNGWAGSLEIVNEHQEVVSTISRPLLYDSFETNDKSAMKGHIGRGAYQLEKVSDGYIVKLLVAASWLNNEALVYPVTIDPTATNTYANNQAVQDKNTQFNSNCQATMNVTIPAGAYQVTGTNITWRMWAKGYIYGSTWDEYYADKTEQRSRIGSGTSWTGTQSGAGTNHSGSNYTYTSANNGYNYTLNNQNIANGCYNSSNITYTWQGYQTYFPHTGSSVPNIAKVAGCSFTYQELVLNTWVVTTTFNPINGTITATPAAPTICSGQSTGITLTSTVSNTTYSWTIVRNGVSGGANGSGSTINQALTATGTTPGTATYTITPMFGSCPGVPITVVVTVNPLPVVNAGPDQTICAGQSVTLSGSGATTYTWNNGVTDGTPFTPTATATYTVTGTLNGCTATDAVIVTVGTLTVNAGADQTVCPGQSVTLTATSPTGGTTFSWDNGVTNGTPFTPTATTTYTVTGTSNGCTATDQVVVTIVSNLTVNAGADQTVCAGQSVTLSGSGATTYTWDNGVTNGVAFTPTATTTYTMTGNLNGCTATDQVVVTVNPLPVVNAGPDQTICAGQQVTLSGSGATTYTWNNGVTNGTPFSPTATATYTVTGTSNGCSATDQVVVTIGALTTLNGGADQSVCAGQPVTLTATGATTYSWNNGVTNGVAFTPTATATYTVTGQSAGGCTATDQVVITVNPVPPVNAGADQSVCAGQPVTLSGSGAATYTWNNGVTNGTAFVPTATTTYTVTGTLNGCTNTDQVIVTVNALPAVTAGADISICEGAQATLTGGGAATYTWNNGVINGTPFAPVSTATYTVTGTSAQGCTATDQVVVTIVPIPVVSFVPSVTSGCLPLTVAFTNTSGTSNNCQWLFGDGTPGTGCGTVTHTYTGSGCYDVTMISTTPEGCVGQQQYTGLICTLADPVAAFTANPNTLTTSSTYTNIVNTSTGASSYIWNFGDGSPLSTLPEPGHGFPSGSEGMYNIMLIAINSMGCRDTAFVYIKVENELVYYIPNTFTPDDDQHNPVFKPVFTSGFDPYDYVMYIYDRWGELIFESHNAQVGWDGTYANVAGKAKDGVYIWKIEFKTTGTDARKMLTGHVNLIK